MINRLFVSSNILLVRRQFSIKACAVDRQFLNRKDLQLRNFIVTAHVDHGKTMLSSAMLSFAVGRATNMMALDSLPVEQERSITVKTTACAFGLERDHLPFLITLIDTPGHVDFTGEVARALGCADGALLLVDATQSVGAQTISNLRLCKAAGLRIVPALSKVDAADENDIERALDDMSNIGVFDDGTSPDSVLLTSSRLPDQCLPEVFEAVLDRVPAPSCHSEVPSLVVIDSFHDSVHGVVCLVQLHAMPGISVRSGKQLHRHDGASGVESFKIRELGFMQGHDRILVESFCSGMIGYVIMGLRHHVDVGDKFFLSPEQALSGAAAGARERHAEDNRKGPVTGSTNTQKTRMALVNAALFPSDPDQFEMLKVGIEKLLLNDASVQVRPDRSDSLGPGFRCSFSGLLHLEIFLDRLKQEIGVDAVATPPSVAYAVRRRRSGSLKTSSDSDDEVRIISRATEFEEQYFAKEWEILEPTGTLRVHAPVECLGDVLSQLYSRRAVDVETQHNDENGRMVTIQCECPLAELMVDFHSRLLELTSGRGSYSVDLSAAVVDHREANQSELIIDGCRYVPADIVRLDVRINGDLCDGFSQMCARPTAQSKGRKLVGLLKNEIPRQQIPVILQACIQPGNKIAARETVRPVRKDVAQKLYGGDKTRRMKLLEKQKAGKKRMFEMGSVSVPQKAFQAVLKLNND